MPVFIPHAGRSRLLALAGCAFLFLFCSVSLTAAPQHLSAFDKAQRMRESLEGRAEHQRTRRDYERVMDAYRVVYHGDPASPKADASIAAVADLLAEEGRIFQDDKALRDAIGQYEFLRKQYPASRYRFSALLTEGEIYLRDLNDREQAKAAFQQFLKLYPQNAMANEARTELRGLRKPGAKAVPEVAAAPNDSRGDTKIDTKTGSKTKRNAVLTAALQSQQGSQQGAAGAPLAPAKDASVVAAPVRTKTGEMAESDIPPGPVQPELSKPSHLSEAAMTAPPPPRMGKLPLVTSIRHWSTPVYTRVAIDLQDEVQYEAVRVPNPDRIFFDLHGARLSPELIGKSVEVVDDGFLKRVRAAQFSNDVTRIVLDVSDVSDYSAFFLPNPSRLIIDVHGRKSHTPPVYTAAAATPAQPTPSPAAASPAPVKSGPAPVATNVPKTSTTGTPAARGTQAAKVSHQVIDDGEDTNTPDTASGDPAALADVASLGNQPNRVKATKHPTTAPVAQSVADRTPAPATVSAPQTNDLVALNAPPPPATVTPQPHSGRTAKTAHAPDSSMAEIRAAQPTADGQRSMVRALGLKINRIVIDAGHGGHDSGTLGPGGIEEKDVVLDVALRLGTLLKQKLGAEIIYTRDDDTFIPLETRTAIANKAQADLFISVHANSSQDSSARGVEVYYLNFTTSADALEVAARENAVSDQSIHQLSDLVKKITLQDKINESREFAADVDQSLYSGLQDGNPGLKDRGVKKAPFVVLIGANMPSILAEISFLTNPEDAVELRQGQYRERIAESIYRGVERYIGSLSGVRVAQEASHSNQ